MQVGNLTMTWENKQEHGKINKGVRKYTRAWENMHDRGKINKHVGKTQNKARES